MVCDDDDDGGIGMYGSRTMMAKMKERERRSVRKIDSPQAVTEEKVEEEGTYAVSVLCFLSSSSFVMFIQLGQVGGENCLAAVKDS
jgi:hypothetical protein